MTPWLLLDYGEVISLPYDPAALSDVARILELGEGVVEERYWTRRPDLDGGIPTTEYWASVAGRPVEEELAARLDLADIAGWQHTDAAMLDLLEELRRDHGIRLAILSNAPQAQAEAFERATWTGPFERIFVSHPLGMRKPDPAIFTHVLAELDARPEDVTFVDDRQENVEAAAALGIRAVRFTDVPGLRASLLPG